MKLFQLIILLILTIVFTTCKKKTNITVKVFNPALNEYVTGAVVSLMEVKDGSLLTGGSCNEIATATTDVNGIASFDREKLRTNKKYHYKVGIKESWGIAHQNPCSGQTQNYLDVGKSQEIQLSDYLETSVNLQYNNLLNPSQSGDSIAVSVTTIVYYDPMIGHTQGGGGVFADYRCNPLCGYPYQSLLLYSNLKTDVSRLVVEQRKRKMGIVTTTIDTVKVYPNQTTTIQINW